jgi:DNA-binding response OmpR family regulator
VIEQVLCIPSCDDALRRALTVAGVAPSVSSPELAATVTADDAEQRFAGAVINGTELALTEAMQLCRTLRGRAQSVGPILLVVRRNQLADLTFREDLFDDFVVTPFDTDELASRLRLRLRHAGNDRVGSRIDYDALSMNLETYQASIAGRILDLTYMEYELLRFLAGNPHRVFTRETLLNRVWGYEYYGGARTVDVHVRRLRAKLGEEYAYLLTTVRSVGYSFGGEPDGLA